MATSEEDAGNLAYSVSMYRSRRFVYFYKKCGFEWVGFVL